MLLIILYNVKNSNNKVINKKLFYIENINSKWI